MEATAKDLRLRVRELLEAVGRGEEVIITYRGEPRARLMPLSSTHDRAERRRDTEALFGIWSDHAATDDVSAYVDALREPRR